MLTIKNIDKLKDYEITNGKFIYYVDGVVSIGNYYVFKLVHHATGVQGEFMLSRTNNKLHWMTQRPIEIDMLNLQSPFMLLAACFRLATSHISVEFWIVDKQNGNVVLNS